MLTPRQQVVLRAIRDHFDARGHMPSLEEIGNAVGGRSIATIYKHVEALVEKGRLRRPRDARTARNFELVDVPSERVALRLLAAYRELVGPTMDLAEDFECEDCGEEMKAGAPFWLREDWEAGEILWVCRRCSRRPGPKIG